MNTWRLETRLKLFLNPPVHNVTTLSSGFQGPFQNWGNLANSPLKHSKRAENRVAFPGTPSTTNNPKSLSQQLILRHTRHSVPLVVEVNYKWSSYLHNASPFNGNWGAGIPLSLLPPPLSEAEIVVWAWFMFATIRAAHEQDLAA